MGACGRAAGLRRRAAAWVCGLLAAAAAPAGAQVQAQRWSFTASASATYVDDILFVGDAGPDDGVGTGSLSLGWVRLTDRTQASLSGFVSYRKYADLDVFDGGLAAISGSVSHAFDPRFRGSLTYGYSQGISALGRGIDQVVLPDVDISTHVGSASLGFVLTPRTRATLSGSFTRFDYRAERSFTGSLLPFVGQDLDFGDFGLPPGDDGQPIVTDPFELTRQLLAALAIGGTSTTSVTIDTFRAGLGLSHTFSERTRGNASFGWSGLRTDGSVLQPLGRQLDAGVGLGHRIAQTWDLTLSYSFLRNDAQRPPVNTHNATIGVGKRINDRVSVSANIGAGFFGTAETTSRTLIGGLGLSGRGDRSAYSLSYSRATTQALGLGRSFVSDSVSGSWGHGFSRKLSGSIYAAYMNSRDPLADFGYDTMLAGLSLSRRIHQRTAVSLSYSYRRLGRDGFPSVGGSVLGLSVRYGRVWK